MQRTFAGAHACGHPVHIRHTRAHTRTHRHTHTHVHTHTCTHTCTHMYTSIPRTTAGARVKITRSLVYGRDPEGQQPPLLSLGTGLNVDMDRQQLQPVSSAHRSILLREARVVEVPELGLTRQAWGAEVCARPCAWPRTVLQTFLQL